MCTKPLKGFKYGKTANGCDNYIICSPLVDHLEIDSSGRVHRSFTRVLFSTIGKSGKANRIIREYTEIPCGQCMECRLEYSRQWANRCLLESNLHDENCFITLTYENENVPVSKNVANPVTGEVQDYQTLRKEDLQKFFKRLRSRLAEKGIKIRYFACGEYGDTSKRPHFHAIIFGWKPDDARPATYEHNGKQIPILSELGYHYYMSNFLKEVWPYGMALFADCTWETCAYVARYVTKKAKGLTNDIYNKLSIEPEFVVMSRKPGIGADWFKEHNVCYANFLNTYVKTDFGSRKISSNRYFDHLLEQQDPDLLEDLKKIRKEFQKDKKRIELSSTDLTSSELLQVKHDASYAKVKGLSRKL